MNGWWAISFVGLWLIVIVLAATVLALARQIGVLHMRLGPRGALDIDTEGPAIGEMLPPLSAIDIDGRPVELSAPGVERFLLFVSPDCPVCRDVVPAVPAVRRLGLTAAILTTGDGSIYRRYEVPIVSSEEIPQVVGVPGTPFIVVLDAQGIVRAKGTANNLEQIEGLIDDARRGTREASAW